MEHEKLCIVVLCRFKLA